MGIINTEKTKYQIMRQLFQEGRIPEAVWIDYCLNTLEKMMEENKEVLDRLKNV